MGFVAGSDVGDIYNREEPTSLDEILQTAIELPAVVARATEGLPPGVVLELICVEMERLREIMRGI